MKRGKTLFDKIWESHVVKSIEGGQDILYIDRHFIHEVTSPQAFEGLRNRGISVFRPEKTTATVDHNIPTIDQDQEIKDELSRQQVKMLEENCRKNNINLFPIGHENNGIVHVIGPEMGLTQPGMTIVCGDSHTSTHGAFGSIAFGIGTSEVEMVLGTQSILQKKPKQMKIEVKGELQEGVSAKDIILHIISKLGMNGATGHFVEYSGEAIEKLSMEGRMTICNMSIEMGARGGLIAPDKVTYNYMLNTNLKVQDLNSAIEQWNKFYTDSNAIFDQVYVFEISDLKPVITFGTNPGTGINLDQKIKESYEFARSTHFDFNKSIKYMVFNENERLEGKKIDYVFIGSCTNGRIEDLRAAAKVLKNQKVNSDVKVWIVPGSKKVELQAEKEGLTKIFEQAGTKLRQPGCSACLAMNEDKVPEGKICISTSNRNFEGRQGQGARTILASPYTAAASAITGKISDPRDFLLN